MSLVCMLACSTSSLALCAVLRGCAVWLERFAIGSCRAGSVVWGRVIWSIPLVLIHRHRACFHFIFIVMANFNRSVPDTLAIHKFFKFVLCVWLLSHLNVSGAFRPKLACMRCIVGNSRHVVIFLRTWWLATLLNVFLLLFLPTIVLYLSLNACVSVPAYDLTFRRLILSRYSVILQQGRKGGMYKNTCYCRCRKTTV